MLNFIESEDSINKFQDFLYENRTVIIPIFDSKNKHTANISYILVIGLNDNEIYVLNHTHSDSKQLDAIRLLKLCEIPKYAFIYDLKYINHLLQKDTFLDLETVYHWITNKKIVIDLESFNNEYIDMVTDNYNYIPIMKILEAVENQINHILPKLHSLDVNDNLKDYSLVLMQILYDLEKNGINTSNGIDYCDYKFNTSTGRPTNTNGNYNFMAMSKVSGIRKNITSRFRNGSIVHFDYNSFHLHLIADLIDYTFPDGVNLHEYLGQQLLKKNSLTENELKQVKQSNFAAIYGSKTENDHVEFFKKFNTYKRGLYNKFNKLGYIETPIFKRRIYKDNFPDMEQHKLINYLIQAYETERNLYVIYRLNEFLKNKKSILIFYIYDGFVFDYSPDDGTEIFKIMTEIFEENGCKVKMTIGKTYDEV